MAEKGTLEDALGVSSADAEIDFNAGAASVEEVRLIAELKAELKVVAEEQLHRSACVFLTASASA